jgi:hypothetical protein
MRASRDQSGIRQCLHDSSALTLITVEMLLNYTCGIDEDH